jgi:hypothetical protein
LLNIYETIRFLDKKICFSYRFGRSKNNLEKSNIAIKPVPLKKLPKLSPLTFCFHSELLAEFATPEK